MAFQVIGENGTVQQVGGVKLRAAHVHLKPLEYVLGHYRTVMKCTLLAAQAAGSRLFEVRNAGTNLLIPTRLEVTVVPIGSVAFPYLLELAAYRYTGFTAVDTTATVTPSSGAVDTEMAAFPQNAHLRSVTVAGNAAGMTGGTLGTKSGNPFGEVMAWAASVSATALPVVKELTADVSRGGYPMVFRQDQGFVIENVTTGSATANALAVMVDFSWAEAVSY